MGSLAKDTEAFTPASRDRLCSGSRLRRVVKRYLPGCAPTVMAALLGLQPLAAAAAPDYLRYSIVSGKYASAVDVNVNARYAMDKRAFWSNNGGELIDLNTLIDPDADLLLTAAIAINDRDQILAKSCDRAGVFCYDTVLLNNVYAIPEPSEYLMLAMGLALLAARRIRRHGTRGPAV